MLTLITHVKLGRTLPELDNHTLVVAFIPREKSDALLTENKEPYYTRLIDRDSEVLKKFYKENGLNLGILSAAWFLVNTPKKPVVPSLLSKFRVNDATSILKKVPVTIIDTYRYNIKPYYEVGTTLKLKDYSNFTMVEGSVDFISIQDAVNYCAINLSLSDGIPLVELILKCEELFVPGIDIITLKFNGR